MRTSGNRARAAGLAISVISFSAGINIGAGGFGLLLCFAGVLAGVSLVGAGVLMGDDPAPVIPAVFDGARAVTACLRRHLTVVGLAFASSAVTAVSGDAGPMLCFAMLTLFLIGLSLINTGVLGAWMH